MIICKLIVIVLLLVILQNNKMHGTCIEIMSVFLFIQPFRLLYTQCSAKTTIRLFREIYLCVAVYKRFCYTPPSVPSKFLRNRLSFRRCTDKLWPHIPYFNIEVYPLCYFVTCFLSCDAVFVRVCNVMRPACTGSLAYPFLHLVIQLWKPNTDDIQERTLL